MKRRINLYPRGFIKRHLRKLLGAGVIGFGAILIVVSLPAILVRGIRASSSETLASIPVLNYPHLSGPDGYFERLNHFQVRLTRSGWPLPECEEEYNELEAELLTMRSQVSKRDLIHILEDKTPDHLYRIPIVARDLVALGMNTPQAVPALKRALQSGQPFVQRQACFVIRGRSRAALLPDVVGVVERVQPHSPAFGPCVLQALETKPQLTQVTQRLLLGLQSTDPDDRFGALSAIESLSRNHRSQSVKPLVPRLLELMRHDADPLVRQKAIETLGGIPYAAASTVPGLLDTLKTARGGDPATLTTAARAILSLDPRNAELLPLLRRYARDQNLDLRSRAMAAVSWVTTATEPSR